MTATPRPCRCACCTARAALDLLDRGRPAMARTLLVDLVEVLDEMARRPPPKAKPETSRRRDLPAGGTPRPAFRKQGLELLAAVETLGVARVAEILAVGVGDLPPLLAGAIQVSGTALK